MNSKKISIKFTLICGLLMLISIIGLMVPVIANATPSPIVCSADSHGAFMYIRCNYPNNTQGGIVLSADGRVASNMVANPDEGEFHIADFSVLLNGLPSYDDVSNIHIFYSVDNVDLVANQDVKFYVEHHDGTSDVIEEHFDDWGFCDFYIDKLSVFSIVTKTNPGVEWTGYSPDYEEKFGYVSSDYVDRHTKTKGINRSGKSPLTGVEEISNWDVFKYKATKRLAKLF